MNGLVIVLISIVALGAGYLLYGRWLARKWGIDENAQTPAKKFEDGQDFVPSSKFTVFSHQFSSIAGAAAYCFPFRISLCFLSDTYVAGTASVGTVSEGLYLLHDT